MGNEDHGAVSGGTLVEAGMQTGFGIMRTLIEAIISILKMKLRKGLKLLKDVSGKVMA